MEGSVRVLDRIQQIYKDLFGIEPKDDGKIEDNKKDIEVLEEKLEKDLKEVESMESNGK